METEDRLEAKNWDNVEEPAKEVHDTDQAEEDDTDSDLSMYPVEEWEEEKYVREESSDFVWKEKRADRESSDFVSEEMQDREFSDSARETEKPDMNMETGWTMPPQRSLFLGFYKCLPASRFSQPGLEAGDKVVLPVSALVDLVDLNIGHPMLFQLSNWQLGLEKQTHCGVLEFSADDGMIYVPQWIMNKLGLTEGDMVRVADVTMPKGTYVKLQPHSKDFLEISNPKAMLEYVLRGYTCLTTGDTIMLPYNNKQFYIDIVETQPQDAVSIIETDCEVDFAPPLDYIEPERSAVATPAPLEKLTPQEKADIVQKVSEFIPFTGTARRVDEEPTAQHDEKLVGSTTSGTAARKPVKLIFGTNANSGQGVHAPRKLVFGGTGANSGSGGHAAGKLVFGTSANSKVKEESEPKVEDKAIFQAFTGKSYKLG